MSDYAFPPSFRATDADDNPLAGGTMRFYAAGTTTPKAVYSDAARTVTLGTQVSTNSAGVPVSGSNVPILIYYGTGNYKYALYDADGALVPGMEFDNIPGYVEAEEESTTGLPEIPVDSKTTAYTVVSGDRGNLINANPTGGSFAITLPSAVTVGDDFLVGFRHNGTANAVTIVATGSQVIRFQGNRAAFSLVGQGETLWLVSDGSDWIACGYVPPFRKATDPYFIVLDRLTAPPANPDAGARYLINGTPTGAWSTLSFADEDIAEADGNGSWIKHTPAEGWLAFDVDEKVSLVFKNGAWVNFQVDPGESTLKTLIVQDQKSSGTDGGTPTEDAWTASVLNTSVVNTIADSSLASSTITLPAGRYRVKARKVFSVTGESRIRFISEDTTIVFLSESVHAGGSISTQSLNAKVGVTAMLDGEFEITESTDFGLQYYVNVNQGVTAAQGLGIPSSISGSVEVYATVVIEDLAVQQGPKGDEGDTGPDGLDAAYAYQFNTATSGDPGTGKILVNNATPASVTQIAVHQTDANAAVLTAVIATWDDSTSANKARVRFHKEGAPENFFEFLITATGTDVGDYWTFPVSYVSHGGTISNGNDIALLVVQTGDQGDPGTTVPDISGLTIKTAPVLTDDYAIIYDAAGSAAKKYLPFSRDTGLTPIDGASWAQAIGSRIGSNLSAAGSGTPGSANEFGLLIHTYTPVTSSAAGYEKCAALFIAVSSDPSTYGPDIWRDKVGLDMRGYIAADNALGRAWGGYSEGRILTGGDGLLYAHEFYTINNGTDQAAVDTSTSKYGIHLVAGGTNHSTAGIKFTADGVSYRTGIYFSASAIVTHALYAPSLFSLRITGAMAFGHDTPDRLVHAEVADAGTTSVVYAARLSHVTSGTAAVGFGVGLEHELENASGTNRVAGVAQVEWSDATNATEDALYKITLMRAGTLADAFTVSSLGVMTLAGDLLAINTVNAIASAAAATLVTNRTDTHGDEADVGQIASYGRSSTGVSTLYSLQKARALLDDNGAEYGQYVWQLRNAGVMTSVMTLTPFGGLEVLGAYYVGANKVVGARDTGWTAMTGTPNEAATYDVASVTLPQLAGRVAAIQAALTTHGLIGT
jgi:hypothetical protein